MKIRNFEIWLRHRRIKLFKRLGGTKRGLKLLLDFLPEDVTELTVERSDHRITVSPHELIGRHVVAKGHFARDAVSDLFKELDARGLLPEQGGCILEVGANIGTHTLYFAATRRFDRIVAIEPDPRNLSLLRRNVEINGLNDVVRVVGCAAGEEESELLLHRVARNHGNSSFLHAHPSGDGIVVPVRPVDMILREAKIPQESITLVWMDIEGFEPQALRSMCDLLERQVPLYMEFSPEFYGVEGTPSFVHFLERYYSECIVIAKGRRENMAVSELALQDRQCDVLFLPSKL